MTLDQISDLVEEIQRIMSSGIFMTSDPMTLESELMNLASQLEEANDQVTYRLKQVEKFLNQGLRSEAIELAERDPNLNDLITVLDFPEFDTWNEYLTHYKISPVKRLPLELAAELNAAYASSASVENLLNRFRVQSMSRAPLPLRIDTLRRLSAVDTSNPIWNRDLQEFEQTRIDELKTQLQRAIRTSDLDQLAKLDHELTTGTWSVKVPQGLIKQAATAHRAVRRTVSRQELDELSYQLSDAYADFDLRSARQFRQRFDALRQIIQLSPDDPIMDVAGPALDWLDQVADKERIELEHANSICDLESALEHNAGLEELKRLYHQATKHDHSVPPHLETRLADRLETLQVQATRKRTSIIVVSSVSALAMVAAVLLLVRQASIRSEIDGHVAQLTVLLEDAEQSGVLEPAAGYIRRVDEKDGPVANSPEIQGLKQQLERLQISEAGRQSQITAIINSADKITANASRIDQLPEAEEILREANPLVKNQSERNAIAASQAKVREKQTELQSRIDMAFGDELEQLTKQAAALPSDQVEGYMDLQVEVAKLLNRNDVSPQLKTPVEALQNKLRQESTMINRNLRIARDMAGITDSVGRLKDFEAKLRNYAKVNAGTQRAKDFERVLDEDKSLFHGALQWNDIRQKLSKISFKSIRPEEARQLVDEVKRFLEDSGPYPGHTQWESRFNALKTIASRKPGSDDLMSDSIRDIFAARTISSAYQLMTTDDELYYMPSKPVLGRGKDNNIYEFEYFTTSSGTQTASMRLAKGNVKTLTAEPTDSYWLSPQTKLWQQIQSQLNSGGSDFEQNLVEVSQKVMAADAVDPVLRFLILEKLLKLGSENSVFFRARAEKTLRSIGLAEVSRLTNWVDQSDQRADRDRDNAKRFFKHRSAGILEDLQQVTNDRAELEKSPLNPANEWIGWLHRDPSGRWVVSLPSPLASAQNAELFIVVRDARDGIVKKMGVGTYPEGEKTKVAVPDVNPTWAEGQPVFRLIGDS